MTDQRFVILMTACIAPEEGIDSKAGNRLKRFDPVVRLQDYAAALSFWLTHADQRIESVVFADNSGYDLSHLRAVAQATDSRRELEFLSLPRCQWPPHIHYGYCELQIIDEALSRSRLLQSAAYFMKATGRLTFTNVSKLLDGLPPTFRFAVDCRDFKIPFWRRWSSLTTQLMLFEKAYFETNLVGIKTQLAPWAVSHIEDLLFAEFTRSKGVKGAVLRWPVNVDCVGVSATTNVAYSMSQPRAKRAIRGLARKAAPWLWI